MSYGYLSSFSPPETSAPDKSVHNLATRLLGGKRLARWELDELRSALTYRIEMTKLASEYKDLLGINFNDCNDFDFESWQKSALRDDSNSKLLEYRTCRRMIDEANIFNEPTSHQGWEYTKPPKYLAAACVQCDLSEEAVKAGIARMITGKFLYLSISWVEY